MDVKNWEKLKTMDSLIRMQLPVDDPLCNIFNTESMVFSSRSTTFRSSMLSSLSWFKTWSIWRWTWSSISTWINATKQIANATENIADENCEGRWKTWGVFDFSMMCLWFLHSWSDRKRVLKRWWILVQLQLGLLSHSVDQLRQRKCFMGLGFNFFCLTWSPLTTVAIFQTTKNSLSCQLSYFHVILTSMSDSGVNKTVADVIGRVRTKLDQVFKHPRRPRGI